MWAKPDDIGQQTQRLLRVVEPEIFRFVLVQAMPQFAAAEAFSNALTQEFSERPLLRIKLEKQDYALLMQEIEAVESGFVLLENFDRLLENADLYTGFNQRRDRIAARPVALIVFLPTGIVPLRLVQDRIPDFWSFRAFNLEIKYRYLPDLYPIYEPEFREPIFHLNFDQKKAEIERLQRLIAQTPEPEAYLRANLLIQLAGYFTDLFWWPQGQEAAAHALMLLQTLPKGGSATELEFDAMYLQAVILKDKEAFAEAFSTAGKATKLAADQGDWERVLKGLNLQGGVRLKEGRLDEAKYLPSDKALELMTNFVGLAEFESRFISFTKGEDKPMA